MSSDYLQTLEDELDRAQALHDEAAEAQAASQQLRESRLCELRQCKNKTGACKWAVGFYTQSMDEAQQAIDRQITKLMTIAAQEGLQMQKEVQTRQWCAWLSVDPRTGDIVAYPRHVARRLELARQQGQSTISLGPDFFSAAVSLKDFTQRTATGMRSVCRLVVENPRQAEVNIQVIGQPHAGRFAHQLFYRSAKDDSAEAEKKSLHVPAASLVLSQETQPLHPRTMSEPKDFKYDSFTSL